MTAVLSLDVERAAIQHILQGNAPATRTILLQGSEVQAYTVMPKKNITAIAENPFLVVQRIPSGGRRNSTWGGGGPAALFDEAVLQWDCYATTKVLARTLMDTLRSEVPGWVGLPVPGDASGYICDVEEALVGWMPDEDFDPYLARYLVEHRITTRAGSPG